MFGQSLFPSHRVSFHIGENIKALALMFITFGKFDAGLGRKSIFFIT